jgi:hypothetical protein
MVFRVNQGEEDNKLHYLVPILRKTKINCRKMKPKTIANLQS